MGLEGAKYLLGLDAGGTFTKAVIFDERGCQISVGRSEIAVKSPHPRWRERDMGEIWRASASAIRDAMALAGIDGSAVAAVGVTGHNDGAYLVDALHRPVRPGIMATDARASAQAERFSDDDIGQRALVETGQIPSPYSPSAILAWLAEYEPESLEKAHAYIFCKDWLRLCLTGELATDASEASASFTNVETQRWSARALEIFGLSDMARLLPPILPSFGVAGTVIPRAAEETGLRVGTPVVTGSHDVDAVALGIGAIDPGMLSIIMGTFSINQVVSEAPVTDRRWQARNFISDGRWLHMSTSPSSASNFEWSVRRFAGEGPVLDYTREVNSANLHEARSFVESPMFLPYLYGAPLGYGSAGGVLMGLRSIHERKDLIRSVLEGIAFNHLWHVQALRDKLDIMSFARLSGGGANSPAWSQFMASALQMRMEVTDASEAGARGAAALAGIGIGWYLDLRDAVTATVKVKHSYEPEPEIADVAADRFERFKSLMRFAEDFAG